MAWENRNGTYYYYRKRREGERVVSEYCGAGLMGELAEDLNILDRAEADQARAGWLEQKAIAVMMDGQVGEVEKYTKAVTRALLLISGFHPHKRQWRKRRDVR